MPMLTEEEAAARDHRIVKYIVLGNGYVESSQVGHVIFRNQHMDEPLGYLDAFKDLARALFEQYLESLERIGYQETPFIVRPCCKKAVEDPENFFCSKCGKDLRPAVVSFDEYENYLCNFPTMTAAESGEEMDYWWQWVSIQEFLKDCKPSQLLSVSSQAEKFLIGVLDPIIMTPDVKEAWDQWRKHNWHEHMDKSLERIAKGKEPLV